MMSVIIREAKQQDIQIIAQHNILMALETESKKLDVVIVTKAVEAVLLDSSKGFYLVVEKENEILGNLMITYEWSDWRNTNMWWIQSVYVKENYRGQGIFKKLYHYVIELAKTQHVKIIRLYVEKNNIIAQQTYKKLGMTISDYFLFELEVK